MGVVGAGKTTIGTLLAQKLGWHFADADDFHPEENRARMAAGIPLTDSDRGPWLTSLRRAIKQWEAANCKVILACSSLKRSYREQLQAPEEKNTGAVQFTYLKGDYDLILARLRSRHGHFATESILRSQLADLEEPDDSIMVSIAKAPEEIVSEIIGKHVRRWL
jgi:gluconokinase